MLKYFLPKPYYMKTKENKKQQENNPLSFPERMIVLILLFIFGIIAFYAISDKPSDSILNVMIFLLGLLTNQILGIMNKLNT